MAFDIIDYVKWLGGFSYKELCFSDLDALVMCQLSYLNFDGVISQSFSHKTKLSEVWAKFKSLPDYEERTHLGAMINTKSVDLLQACALSKRFGSQYVCGYVSKIDLSKEEQFSCMTFYENVLSKNPFVAFRGTDDTLVGWKEDFNLALSSHIPAQVDALDYLKDVARCSRGKIFVGGHSKGGNLAVYAGSFIDKKYRNRIKTVFNFDGPGFEDRVTQTAEYKQVLPKVHSYFPHLSIVGMLFQHPASYSVVESFGQGVMQHDPFSWSVCAQGFVTKEDFDPASKLFEKTFNAWMKELAPERRELFVETLFNVLEATGARTNSDLEKNWFETARKMVHAMAKIDRETSKEVVEIVKLLLKCAKRNIPDTEWFK
ncbi:MAG: DUF2974 domain-containing protein [Treponema sp.]|nr:DUF2974 domain-containing protein [Treponema sp.]